MTSRSRKPPRVDRSDLIAVLDHLSDWVSVVVVWRRRGPGVWVYCGRFPRAIWEDDPGELLETIQRRFGGGQYRAKIYGPWDPVRKHERFLCQVTFGIWQPGVDG